ncbi:phage tail protein [Bacillus cytotoxicus]|uniref:Phage tail protein n=1 Tax=Bacillus cytotoxicus TaxID=580165 RepID=A0ACC6A780_9BACI|nr:phage tail protein [Bacillus cytotoxicus]
MQPIKLYDKQLRLKAYLENAYKISYEQRLNETWDAAFSLPFDDEKRLSIDELDFVEIFDQDKCIGMFRIMPNATERNEEAKTITYNCEHVLSTLLDDVLFSYHQLTNHTTVEVLEYILSQQEVKRWKLGKCDFKRYFHYGWENENTLLGPLLSVPKPFDQPYQWTWDDSTYPWTLNLVKVSEEITGEIRYRKNLRGIKKHVDPTNIMTRIYPLGYGEGVNQLTVKDVNPTGKYYIEAPANIIEQYGLHKYIWVDRRFKDAQSLFDSAKALLDERSTPKVTYEVQAVDYELIDPYELEKYEVGKLVKVFDEELNIDVVVRVMRKGKSDVTGNPLDVTFDIANKLDDLGTTQADIEKRQQVNEVYAQGSTNMDSSSFSDNCDQDHPAKIKFYLPDDLVNLNSMSLSFETSKFRAFERATKGGGATTVTSSSGGGTVSSTSAGGGASKSTAAGGGTVTTTASGGGGTVTSESATPTFFIYSSTKLPMDNATFDNHYHAIEVKGEELKHSHKVQMQPHYHQMTLIHHTHDFQLEPHTHQVTLESHHHELTLPDHVHEIEFGIYEIDMVPSSIRITVDGNELPITATSGENIDIIPYLSKDDNGKVNRGRWVEITLTPNDLARIDATVNSRLFISSHIGGTF